MKKIVALLLAFVFLMMLVGCDTSSSTGNGQNTTTYGDPTRGKIEGAVYTSDYMGIKFTKPSSWVYSTDAEIAAMMNVGAEYLVGDKYAEVLEKAASIYDMMVVDTLTGTNLNLGYENLEKSMATNITVEQYIEALKNQFANVSGMTVKFPDEYTTVKLGENEYTRAVCETTMSGMKITQVFYLRKMDKYMGFIIVTLVSGYDVADIEAMFS